MNNVSLFMFIIILSAPGLYPNSPGSTNMFLNDSIKTSVYDSIDSIDGINYRFPLSLKSSIFPIINYNGISFLSLNEIPEKDITTINGINFNLSLGNMILEGPNKYHYKIDLNGISCSLLLISTEGTINGLAFGGFYGLGSKKLNGIGMGILGSGMDTLNGISVGGLGSGGRISNGILIGGLMCSFERLNGIAVACINIDEPINEPNISHANGILIGILNKIDTNGLSLGVINNNNSWVQIGLFNKGNSAVQIGLFNFDENMRFNFPFINIKL